MAQLSEWVQLMLAEIARKADDARRAADEEAARRRSTVAAPASTPSQDGTSVAS